MKATSEIVRLLPTGRLDLEIGDEVLVRMKIVASDQTDGTIKLAGKNQTTDGLWLSYCDPDLYARLEPPLKPGDRVRIVGNPLEVTVAAVVADHAWIGADDEYPGTIHPLKNLEKIS